MPYTIRRRKRCYQVVNKKSQRVFSKCSTKTKASRQLRLLRAIQYNKNFVPNNRSRTQRRIRI